MVEWKDYRLDDKESRQVEKLIYSRSLTQYVFKQLRMNIDA